MKAIADIRYLLPSIESSAFSLRWTVKEGEPKIKCASVNTIAIKKNVPSWDRTSNLSINSRTR